MILVAINFPLTVASQLCIGVLVFLVILHSMECFMFRKLILQAPGRDSWHLLNVVLFGAIHMFAMKDAIRASGRVPL
jgi:uncharacterized protein YhhL (DUF1145 family)